MHISFSAEGNMHLHTDKGLAVQYYPILHLHYGGIDFKYLVVYVIYMSQNVSNFSFNRHRFSATAS